ncbi:hypothetical protein ACS0TY_029528 [Phlomoides rotata]
MIKARANRRKRTRKGEIPVVSYEDNKLQYQRGGESDKTKRSEGFSETDESRRLLHSRVQKRTVGDFNAIKEESERLGRAEFSDKRGIRLFQEFIELSNLIDLSLRGHSYTWYCLDGSCKSRLDRLLVNDQWLHNWPNATLKGMRRPVSDHCPIFTDFGKKNWGPKPFRFFNSWLSHEGLGSFVAEKWISYNITGWAGFVLKEKLKMLKEDLKVWNQ